MSEVAKIMAEDIDVARLRLKLGGALEKITRGNVDVLALRSKFDDVIGSIVQAGVASHRKRELHVSDFTGSDVEFCHRRLVVRWLNGERKDRQPNWVHYDGKWREAKWWMLFEVAGILKEYQPALTMGELQGHPDFVIDFGKGPSLVELTGQDSKTGETLMAMRRHVKRRQNTMYQLMWNNTREVPLYKGFVVIEDKGTNEFKIETVEIEKDKGAALLERVSIANAYCKMLGDAVSAGERIKLFAEIPLCIRERCKTCHPPSE
jgi:hypothetical protein